MVLQINIHLFYLNGVITNQVGIFHSLNTKDLCITGDQLCIRFTIHNSIFAILFFNKPLTTKLVYGRHAIAAHKGLTCRNKIFAVIFPFAYFLQRINTVASRNCNRSSSFCCEQRNFSLIGSRSFNFSGDSQNLLRICLGIHNPHPINLWSQSRPIYIRSRFNEHGNRVVLQVYRKLELLEISIPDRMHTVKCGISRVDCKFCTVSSRCTRNHSLDCIDTQEFGFAIRKGFVSLNLQRDIAVIFTGKVFCNQFFSCKNVTLVSVTEKQLENRETISQLLSFQREIRTRFLDSKSRTAGCSKRQFTLFDFQRDKFVSAIIAFQYSFRINNPFINARCQIRDQGLCRSIKRQNLLSRLIG